MKPGVRVGEDFLVKEVFVEDRRLHTVTDIRFGELDPNPGLEVGIAGRRGAIFAEADGTPVGFVGFGFGRVYRKSTIVDADGDGVCEFFIDWPGGLLDHRGHRLWSTTSVMRSVLQSAYGDVDGDGKTEFVLYYHGKLALLDEKGGVIGLKKPPLHLASLQVADVDGDGKTEILLAKYQKVVVLNAKGEVVQEIRSDLNVYLSESVLAHFPTLTSPQYFLGNGKGTFLLVSPHDGTLIEEFEREHYLQHKEATPVRFNPDGDPYFAIFGDLFWQGRKRWGLEAIHSVLYVYDSEQNIVYEEVIADQSAAIAAVPSGRANEEVLLVGGTGKVWRYRIARNVESEVSQ
jgi:hypothetical protein